MNQATTPSLSIIIITRNEAANIGLVIESALQEAAIYPGTEIVVVDSASTDETIEIARQYPIGVFCMPPTWQLSAAAGRYIGYLNTSGEYILHLDGDMALVQGWLGKALPYMAANPQLAGCNGYWENIYKEEGKIIYREMHEWEEGVGLEQVEEFGGAALYRRAALDKVGGFNPYIYSYEEPELCARLRAVGYELVRLPEQIGEHYGLPEHSVASYKRRWQNRLWVGSGQILRYHLGKPTFPMVARLQGGSYLISSLLAFLGFIGLILFGLARRSGWPLFLAGGGMAAFVALLVIKKRSIPEAGLSLWLRVLIVLSGIKGFLLPPHDPATYPTNPEIIQPIPQILEMPNPDKSEP